MSNEQTQHKTCEFKDCENTDGLENIEVDVLTYRDDDDDEVDEEDEIDERTGKKKIKMETKKFCPMHVFLVTKKLLVDKKTELWDLKNQDPPLNNRAAKLIGELLRRNQNVKILDLRKNSIKIKGIIAISEDIRSNTTLQNIDIRENPFFSQEGAVKHYLNILRRERIKTFCGLGPEEFKKIEEEKAKKAGDGDGDGEEKKDDKKPKPFQDWCDEFGKDNSSAHRKVRKCLVEKSFLMRYDLKESEKEWHMISREPKLVDEDMKEIAKYVKRGHVFWYPGRKGKEPICRLNELRLSGNAITDVGVKIIIEAMGEPNAFKLEQLYLHHNLVTAVGAKIIAEYLKKDKTLTVLNLFNNAVEDEGAQAFYEALEVNTTIKKLDIDKNGKDLTGEKAPKKWDDRKEIGDKIKDKLKGLLKDHASLKYLGDEFLDEGEDM